MGAVNVVVAARRPRGRSPSRWRAEINGKSPTAQRMLKFAFNLIDDGLVGQQVFAGEATRLAYMTDEAAEGRDAFLEKRDPDWSPYPWYSPRAFPRLTDEGLVAIPQAAEVSGEAARSAPRATSSRPEDRRADERVASWRQCAGRRG